MTDSAKKPRTTPRRKTGTHPQRAPRNPRNGSHIGRAMEITDEITDKICQALKLGAPMDTARAYAGVLAPTFATWLVKGRRGEEPYVPFINAVDLAIAEGKMRDVARIDHHADKDWRAAAWKLERRFPDEFGEVKRLDQSVTVSAKPMIDPSKLTLDQLAELRKLLAAGAPDPEGLPRDAAPASQMIEAVIEGVIVQEEDVA